MSDDCLDDARDCLAVLRLVYQCIGRLTYDGKQQGAAIGDVCTLLVGASKRLQDYCDLRIFKQKEEKAPLKPIPSQKGGK